MRKGFTLLELIVVIVILGVMATLAASQYTRMVEKSRGAEARNMLGIVRTNEAAIKQQSNACSSVGGDVGIGGELPSACFTTHYFSYALTAAVGNSFTATATRCTTNGKNPNYTNTNTVILTTNFDNGFDSWSVQAPY